MATSLRVISPADERVYPPVSTANKNGARVTSLCVRLSRHFEFLIPGGNEIVRICRVGCSQQCATGILSWKKESAFCMDGSIDRTVTEKRNIRVSIPSSAIRSANSFTSYGNIDQCHLATRVCDPFEDTLVLCESILPWCVTRS